MMSFLIILLLISVERSEQRTALLYERFSDREDALPSCVNRIIKYHFDWKNQVTILSQGSKDYVNGIRNRVWMIANVSKVDRISWSPRTKQAVVFLDGDFHRDLNVLISLKTFHSLSRFLIVSTISDNDLSEKNYLLKVIRYLHENQRWSVAIVIKSNDPVLGGVVNLYGYTKTAYRNCDNPVLLNFGNCTDENIVSHLFSMKINYNRCPLRLATYDWPPFNTFIIKNGQRISVGIESSLINIIADQLNATKLYATADPSEIRIILENNEADIGYGQMALYDSHAYLYTTSWSFVQGLVLMPNYMITDNWVFNNLMPFQMTVWLLIALVAILLIILRIILPVFKVISIVNNVALSLAYGIKTKVKRTPQRMWLISLIIFGCVITQAYVTNLTMVLTKTSGYVKINSLKELDKSKISFGGSYSSRRFFQKKYPRLHREFKSMDLAEFTQNFLRLMGGHGGIATYVEISRYMNSKHWKKTILIPDIINSYPVAMILPNSSIILSICDRTIIAIVEAGLIEHWANLLDHEKFLTDDTNDEKEKDDRIELEEFIAVFLLHGMALGFCTSVFIIELILGFCQRK